MRNHAWFFVAAGEAASGSGGTAGLSSSVWSDGSTAGQASSGTRGYPHGRKSINPKSQTKK